MSVNGVDSLMKKLTAIGGNANEVLKRSISTQIKYVLGEAKDLCPVDSGDLRQSIFTDMKASQGEVLGKVFTNMEHASYVEFGTGKVGETTPVAGKYLGALSYKQDKWLVNIPEVGPRWIEGQPAQPFLYPALKNSEDIIIKGIKKNLKRAIKEVSGK